MLATGLPGARADSANRGAAGAEAAAVLGEGAGGVGATPALRPRSALLLKGTGDRALPPPGRFQWEGNGVRTPPGL